MDMNDRTHRSKGHNHSSSGHGEGKSPSSPMDHPKMSHNKHAGHDPGMFRDKFWLSLLMSLPVLFWSEHIQMLLGFRAPQFPGSNLIAPLLSTVIFFYGGWVFIQGAVRELRNRLPGMMTLISLAIAVAFLFSWVVLLGLVQAEALWWELATLITIMLLGHWMEMRSVAQAQGALQEIEKLLPDTATRITDKGEEQVSVHDLQKGDRILVRPGENIPADGIIQKGESDVDESILTGESRLVTKQVDDEVIAGTRNGDGSLQVEVTGIGEDTKLSGIMRLVLEAQDSRSRAQNLADRAAQMLTGVAIFSGIATWIAWRYLGMPIDFTIVRVVTVLVIACPHALGLAVPLVVAISTTMGAKNGLLVRERLGLEEARNLDVVVFDKTGTLTLGEFRVVSMTVGGGVTEDEALQMAASIEVNSEHPIARGIIQSAQEKGIEILEVDKFQAMSGKGVSAVLSGSEYMLGGSGLIKSQDAHLSEILEEEAKKADRLGHTAIYLLRDNQVLAVFSVADAIRKESREAVDNLQKNGIEVAMLTGDAQAVADAVAEELGINQVFAEVLPEDKASKVRELQKTGKKVAMVGDGVNDAPALATADIGIAVGAGTDVAVETGHIVLVRSDPRDVSRIITLSKATHRKMVQNLWWAAGYNIAAIPLAAGVLIGRGILLTPAVGAVLMSASTVIVVINAQLLRRTVL